MNHVVSCEQFSKEELDRLFKLADDMRDNPKKYSNALSDKIVATIFYEPSTRTRLSFESAILRLGGKNISTENAKEMSSAIKGESLLDTIRVMAGYCDGIIIRHHENDAATKAASVSSVPIINGGSGSGEHPTQALLDVYTIFEYKHRIDNLSVAIIGDLLFSRTIHSLLKLLANYENITVYGVSKKELSLSEDYKNYLKNKNINYIVCESLEDLPKNIDVIYHTRTQIERFMNSDLNVEEIIIDKKVLDTFSEETIIMHPLPRNKEIAPDVDNDKRAAYFKQAHNGVFIRMALLYTILLKENKI